jgi:hypothetical protein
MKKLTRKLGEKQGTILQIVLGGIMVMFIAIMIGVYLIAREANPIMLDEQGRPKNAATEKPRH